MRPRQQTGRGQPPLPRKRRIHQEHLIVRLHAGRHGVHRGHAHMARSRGTPGSKGAGSLYR